MLTRINNLNAESKNIIEYLIEKEKLDLEKFSLILDTVKNASLITSEVLCQLIELKKFKFIDAILQYKFFDLTFILNLLFAYKNKTKISKGELQNKIYHLNQSIIKINNKTKTGNYPFLCAIHKGNIEIIKLLIEYQIKIILF